MRNRDDAERELTKLYQQKQDAETRGDHEEYARINKNIFDVERLLHGFIENGQ